MSHGELEPVTKHAGSTLAQLVAQYTSQTFQKPLFVTCVPVFLKSLVVVLSNELCKSTLQVHVFRLKLSDEPDTLACISVQTSYTKQEKCLLW